MAKRYITVDDLPGEEAETTEVVITIGGQERQLDLTEQSLAALQALGTDEGSALLATLFKSTGDGSNGSRGKNSNGSKSNGSTGVVARAAPPRS
jgi:hypothetical protein